MFSKSGPQYIMLVDATTVLSHSCLVGGLKSPHRRTMSEDTSKDNQPESNEPQSDWTNRPAKVPILSSVIPQKFATLPRQWAPGDERAESWDSSGTATGASSKSAEGRRDGKKKDKVSLFERVTGKKDAKRSERHSQEISDWSVEGRGSDVPQTLAPGYESTNPFRVGSHAPEQR